MKNLLLPLCLILIIFSLNHRPQQLALDSINPIIGDISFIEKFNIEPNVETNEITRNKTHLEYIEKYLRNKDVSHLPIHLAENRIKLLNLLKSYTLSAKFPQNFENKNNRRPCFKDKNGNICAVGYLIQQTVGSDVVDKINTDFKYSEVYEINSSILLEWVTNSGLSLLECAMIQPAYGFVDEENYVQKNYVDISILATGINSFLTWHNIKNNKPKNKTFPTLGIVSGTSQIIIGALNYQKDKTSPFGLTVSKRNTRIASLFNIGIGISTVFTSVRKLKGIKQNKDKTMSWDVFSFPVSNNQVGYGFSVTKRF